MVVPGCEYEKEKIDGNKRPKSIKKKPRELKVERGEGIN